MSINAGLLILRLFDLGKKLKLNTQTYIVLRI